MRRKSLSRTHFSLTPLKLTWVHNDLLFHERFEYHAFSDFGDNIMAAPLRALLDYSKILNELRFLIKADFKDLLCSLQKPDKQKVEKTTKCYIDFFLEMRFHADLTQQEQQVQKKKDAKSCFDKQLIKIFVEQKKQCEEL